MFETPDGTPYLKSPDMGPGGNPEEVPRLPTSDGTISVALLGVCARAARGTLIPIRTITWRTASSPQTYGPPPSRSALNAPYAYTWEGGLLGAPGARAARRAGGAVPSGPSSRKLPIRRDGVSRPSTVSSAGQNMASPMTRPQSSPTNPPAFCIREPVLIRSMDALGTERSERVGR